MDTVITSVCVSVCVCVCMYVCFLLIVSKTKPGSPNLVHKMTLRNPGRLGIVFGSRRSKVKHTQFGCWFVGGDDLTGALHDL